MTRGAKELPAINSRKSFGILNGEDSNPPPEYFGDSIPVPGTATVSPPSPWKKNTV